MKCKSILYLCLAGPVLAAPPRLVFEAESAATLEAPMVVVAADQVPAGSAFAPGASAGRYLEIPEKAGNPPKLEKGFASYTFDLPEEGDYILWARVW